jgi:hypothetical protein
MLKVTTSGERSAAPPPGRIHEWAISAAELVDLHASAEVVRSAPDGT